MGLATLLGWITATMTSAVQIHPAFLFFLQLCGYALRIALPYIKYYLVIQGDIFFYSALFVNQWTFAATLVDPFFASQITLYNGAMFIVCSVACTHDIAQVYTSWRANR